MSDINYGQILEVLNDKCDRDMGNSEKPYITETYSNGTSWYRVWSDGWCEQGGIVAEQSSSGVDITVSLLKTMVDTGYYINFVTKQTSGTPDNQSAQSRKNIRVWGITTSSFMVRCYNDATCAWEAKGYIA